ncbi:YodC family protein [Acinetobacter pittii]|uniref:YodC family protein n=1 Tax=Acinetobacter TaxID=469 RepID=UPI003261B519
MSVERKPKYAIGDIVKLNAGGPDMTIRSQGRYRPRDSETYQFNGIYECQWFAGKKLESGDFREESLDLVKSKS